MTGALIFDSDALSPDLRLAAFRAGAADFRVEPAGDAAAFTARWRLLALSDINVIHATISPLSYVRDDDMISADGRDRIAIHYYLAGGATGMLDGRPVCAEPGEAMVWDLACPLSIRSTGPSELIILTFPRHVLAEAVARDRYSAHVRASSLLRSAMAATRLVIADAGTLPGGSIPAFARVLRDLWAAAILPALGMQDRGSDDFALIRGILELIDADPAVAHDEATMAAHLGVDALTIAAAIREREPLDVLVEQRRLLAAYRLLDDRTRTDSIATIAWKVGFGDASHFTRRFRHAFGVTPSVFRRTHVARLPHWAGAYPVARLYGRMIDRRDAND